MGPDIAGSCRLRMYQIPREISAESLYVHVPFCRRRCGYCDFALMVGRDRLMDDYVRAISEELSRFQFQRAFRTLYFGGGTPTHLSCEAMERLFRAVRSAVDLSPDCEITVEANPDDLTPEKTDQLRTLGVNRISIGIQSFESAKLQRLERTHRGSQATDCLKRLVAEGWSVSVDLMFGVVGDTVKTWENELRHAVDLGIEHLSTYNLTIEKGTAFWSRWNRGEEIGVDEERRGLVRSNDRLAHGSRLGALRNLKFLSRRPSLPPQLSVLAGRTLAGSRSECCQLSRFGALAKPQQPVDVPSTLLGRWRRRVDVRSVDAGTSRSRKADIWTAADRRSAA